MNAMDAIAPDWVRYDIRHIAEEWIKDLHPDEKAIAAGFSPARRIEFATGRTSVRGLFPEVLSADCPILIGERRAPILPQGLHASISHCETFVATAASTTAHIRGLGIDIEFSDRVTPDLTNTILSCFEKANLPTRTLACYFSSKEAVFKAIHGIIGKYIDFQDIDLTFCLDHFAAQPRFSDPMLNDIKVEGLVTECGRYVLAIAWALSASAHASASM